jgi:uncharacterized membrane protein YbhN (UPF0104 family)
MSLPLGFATLFALALLLHHDASAAQALGGIGLILVLGGFALWLGAGKTFSVAGVALPLPPGRVAILQMTIGAVEMAAAIGALYLLMPPDMTLPFADFSALYISAVLLGIASHTPGGIGVFEATMLSLTGTHDKAAILAALLLYRLVYNLLPFALALCALGWSELAFSLKAGNALKGGPDGNKA